MSQNSLLDLYAHPTVVARFSEMAALHPHREAIRDRFGSVDYRQLLDSAEQLSDYLLEHYPQPGVCLECTANILGKALPACSPYCYPAITTYI
ncbi:hypothetical protein [Pseudomonas aeruginosa]|uniref:hypothetical protein n=1 Tax=Pseudomonas aeruginosa TaxID=287 RepID=UPI001783C09A|nr:hypothetical protein [Pseudomonas aeruginosa]